MYAPEPSSSRSSASSASASSRVPSSLRYAAIALDRVAQLDLAQAREPQRHLDPRVLRRLDLPEPHQRRRQRPVVLGLGADRRQRPRRPQRRRILRARVERRLVRHPRLAPVAELQQQVAEVSVDPRAHHRSLAPVAARVRTRVASSCLSSADAILTKRARTS